eukprot:TRINITY_DN70_c0_g1_i1.p1 TRINITY_DN70_c0_g1~~TRINITY_DN70_c0_g1_i1.p1  ORF type:complete len:1686 (-),score=167.32 TRINITY_DN70_c0_g1_i1:943-6000(-)
MEQSPEKVPEDGPSLSCAQMSNDDNLWGEHGNELPFGDLAASSCFSDFQDPLPMPLADPVPDRLDTLTSSMIGGLQKMHESSEALIEVDESSKPSLFSPSIPNRLDILTSSIMGDLQKMQGSLGLPPEQDRISKPISGGSPWQAHSLHALEVPNTRCVGQLTGSSVTFSEGSITVPFSSSGSDLQHTLSGLGSDSLQLGKRRDSQFPAYDSHQDIGQLTPYHSQNLSGLDVPDIQGFLLPYDSLGDSSSMQEYQAQAPPLAPQRLVGTAHDPLQKNLRRQVAPVDSMVFQATVLLRKNSGAESTGQRRHQSTDRQTVAREDASAAIRLARPDIRPANREKAEQVQPSGLQSGPADHEQIQHVPQPAAGTSRIRKLDIQLGIPLTTKTPIGSATSSPLLIPPPFSANHLQSAKQPQSASQVESASQLQSTLSQNFRPTSHDAGMGSFQPHFPPFASNESIPLPTPASQPPTLLSRLQELTSSLPLQGRQSKTSRERSPIEGERTKSPQEFLPHAEDLRWKLPSPRLGRSNAPGAGASGMPWREDRAAENPGSGSLGLPRGSPIHDTSKHETLRETLPFPHSGETTAFQPLSVYRVGSSSSILSHRMVERELARSESLPSIPLSFPLLAGLTSVTAQPDRVSGFIKEWDHTSLHPLQEGSRLGEPIRGTQDFVSDLPTEFPRLFRPQLDSHTANSMQRNRYNASFGPQPSISSEPNYERPPGQSDMVGSSLPAQDSRSNVPDFSRYNRAESLPQRNPLAIPLSSFPFSAGPTGGTSVAGNVIRLLEETWPPLSSRNQDSSRFPVEARSPNANALYARSDAFAGNLPSPPGPLRAPLQSQQSSSLMRTGHRVMGNRVTDDRAMDNRVIDNRAIHDRAIDERLNPSVLNVESGLEGYIASEVQEVHARQRSSAHPMWSAASPYGIYEEELRQNVLSHGAPLILPVENSLTGTRREFPPYSNPRSSLSIACVPAAPDFPNFPISQAGAPIRLDKKSLTLERDFPLYSNPKGSFPSASAPAAPNFPNSPLSQMGASLTGSKEQSLPGQRDFPPYANTRDSFPVASATLASSFRSSASALPDAPLTGSEEKFLSGQRTFPPDANTRDNFPPSSPPSAPNFAHSPFSQPGARRMRPAPVETSLVGHRSLHDAPSQPYFPPQFEMQNTFPVSARLTAKTWTFASAPAGRDGDGSTVPHNRGPTHSAQQESSMGRIGKQRSSFEHGRGRRPDGMMERLDETARDEGDTPMRHGASDVYIRSLSENNDMRLSEIYPAVAPPLRSRLEATPTDFDREMRGIQHQSLRPPYMSPLTGGFQSLAVLSNPVPGHPFPGLGVSPLIDPESDTDAAISMQRITAQPEASGPLYTASGERDWTANYNMPPRISLLKKDGPSTGKERLGNVPFSFGQMSKNVQDFTSLSGMSSSSQLANGGTNLNPMPGRTSGPLEEQLEASGGCTRSAESLATVSRVPWGSVSSPLSLASYPRSFPPFVHRENFPSSHSAPLPTSMALERSPLERDSATKRRGVRLLSSAEGNEGIERLSNYKVSRTGESMRRRSMSVQGRSGNVDAVGNQKEEERSLRREALAFHDTTRGGEQGAPGTAEPSNDEVATRGQEGEDERMQHSGSQSQLSSIHSREIPLEVQLHQLEEEWKGQSTLSCVTDLNYLDSLLSRGATRLPSDGGSVCLDEYIAQGNN